MKTGIHKPQAGPISRYDGGYDARIPANGLARSVPSMNVRTAVAAVEDPMEPNRRLKATVNRRVDILEQERSHRRITEAAYLTGRVALAVFERASGARDHGEDAGVRPSLEHIRDLPIILAIDDARAVAAYEKWIVSVLGQLDARILRYVLRDRKTFAQIAEMRGRNSERGKSYFADRFRDALETLAHALAARGLERVAIRSERTAPVEGEEYDERGCLVPAGEGYRVAADPDRLTNLHQGVQDS